jgi:hypothetical protein
MMKKGSPLKYRAELFSASAYGESGSEEKVKTKSNETLEGEGSEKAMPAYFDTKTRPTAKELLGIGKNKDFKKIVPNEEAKKSLPESNENFFKRTSLEEFAKKEKTGLAKDSIGAFEEGGSNISLDQNLSAFNQVSDGYNRAMMRGKLYQMSDEYKKMKNGK